MTHSFHFLRKIWEGVCDGNCCVLEEDDACRCIGSNRDSVLDDRECQIETVVWMTEKVGMRRGHDFTKTEEDTLLVHVEEVQTDPLRCLPLDGRCNIKYRTVSSLESKHSSRNGPLAVYIPGKGVTSVGLVRSTTTNRRNRDLGLS